MYITNLCIFHLTTPISSLNRRLLRNMNALSRAFGALYGKFRFIPRALRSRLTIFKLPTSPILVKVCICWCKNVQTD